MPRLGLLRISDLINGIRAGLSRMEILALYPILALAAVWFGNWDLLLVTAFLLPTLLALQAFGQAEPRRKDPFRQQIVDRPTGFPTRHTVLACEVEAALTNGEIKAWYQPQICTDTGLISGFEALARWHHPEDGILAPAEFLGAVAEAGQMSRLGKVMLYNALSALKSWDRARLNIATVAVNFSTEELRDPLLADWIKWEVDRFDLRPNRLTVEILETVTAQSEDDIILRNIELLSRHGVNLDLDDFGTGQASIANIRRFHVSRIKMDRSFVTKLDEDPTQYAMVSAILSLAEHLGLDTLAEGVETAGEHSTLAQLGCGYVQGFGIARPMPFEDTIAWAHAYNQKLGTSTRIRRQAG